MADRCMVCGLVEHDWRRDDGFLCLEHWKLVSAPSRKRFTKAASRFKTMRAIYSDKDHPARDEAAGAVVEAWRAIKAEVDGKAEEAAPDLFSRLSA